MPWLFTQRDLQRFTYRALNACKRGRVVFFRYRHKSGTVLMGLIQLPEHPGAFTAACASFSVGRFRRIRLEDLPRIHPAGRPRYARQAHGSRPKRRHPPGSVR